MIGSTRRGGIILALTAIFVIGLGAAGWACLPDSSSDSAAEASDGAGADAGKGAVATEGSAQSASSGHSLAFSLGLVAGGLLLLATGGGAVALHRYGSASQTAVSG